MKDVFFEAVKTKLRFNTSRGVLTAECLCSIPLRELNEYVLQLKEVFEKSNSAGYLKRVSDHEDTPAELKFLVAEAIIIRRVEEQEMAEKSQDNKLKREKLLAIIASKEAQTLEDEDIDALRSMADELK